MACQRSLNKETEDIVTKILMMSYALFIVVVVVLAIVLLLVLIIRNKQDRRDLEKTLNEDFGRPEKHRENEDID